MRHSNICSAGRLAPSGEADVTPAALLEMAESWRPWRAYAAQHLWMAEDVTDRIGERRRHA
jgi:3-methyladenine DNA glycosylase/8-oxoguanine DNA glycosylase